MHAKNELLLEVGLDVLSEGTRCRGQQWAPDMSSVCHCGVSGPGHSIASVLNEEGQLFTPTLSSNLGGTLRGNIKTQATMGDAPSFPEAPRSSSASYAKAYLEKKDESRTRSTTPAAS